MSTGKIGERMNLIDADELIDILRDWIIRSEDSTARCFNSVISQIEDMKQNPSSEILELKERRKAMFTPITGAYL